MAAKTNRSANQIGSRVGVSDLCTFLAQSKSAESMSPTQLTASCRLQAVAPPARARIAPTWKDFLPRAGGLAPSASHLRPLDVS